MGGDEKTKRMLLKDSAAGTSMSESLPILRVANRKLLLYSEMNSSHRDGESMYMTGILARVCRRIPGGTGHPHDE